MKQSYYELEISGEGGEYTAGVVEDQTYIDLLRAKKKNGELDLYNYSDDDSIEVVYYDVDNIMHRYGINIKAGFTVKKIKAYDEDAESIVLASNEHIWKGGEADVLYTATDIPYIGEGIKKETDNKDAVVFVAASYGDGLADKYVITTNGEEFDPKNLFFLTVSVGKLLYATELIIDPLYFTNAQLEAFMEEKIQNDPHKDIYKTVWEKYKDNIQQDHSYRVPFIKEITDKIRLAMGISREKISNKNIFSQFELKNIDSEEVDMKYSDVILYDLDGNTI